MARILINYDMTDLQPQSGSALPSPTRNSPLCSPLRLRIGCTRLMLVTVLAILPFSELSVPVLTFLTLCCLHRAQKSELNLPLYKELLPKYLQENVKVPSNLQPTCSLPPSGAVLGGTNSACPLGPLRGICSLVGIAFSLLLFLVPGL